MTVIEGHRAAVGNGIKTKLLGMLRIPGTDVFSPAEREYLPGQTGPSGWLVLGTVLSPAEQQNGVPFFAHRVGMASGKGQYLVEKKLGTGTAD